jgi:hypothetical protein
MISILEIYTLYAYSAILTKHNVCLSIQQIIMTDFYQSTRVLLIWIAMFPAMFNSKVSKPRNVVTLATVGNITATCTIDMRYYDM